jgi:hypothetical protein
MYIPGLANTHRIIEPHESAPVDSRAQVSSEGTRYMCCWESVREHGAVKLGVPNGDTDALVGGLEVSGRR